MVTSAISSAPLGEDRRLGTGLVVLRQPGDVLEQLAAPGVVEVLRRQRLGRRGQSSADVGAQGTRPGPRASGGGRSSCGLPDGVSVRPSAPTCTAVRSASSRQPGSSSCGSEARTVPSGVGQHVQRLADDDAGHRAAVGGEHRQPPPAVREHVPRGAGQPGGERLAACHRASASPNSSAESTPTRVSGTSAACGPRALRARGPVVQAAVVAEQPAAVGERCGRRLVGRRAGRRGPDRRDRAGRRDRRRQGRERRVGPDRLGPPVAHRRRTRSTYQPTPKPSTLTVPCRCRRGAQDCS